MVLIMLIVAIIIVVANYIPLVQNVTVVPNPDYVLVQNATQ